MVAVAGSKDASVGLSRVTPAGLATVRTFSDAFESVVKTVRWQPIAAGASDDHAMLAAGGNDRVIALYDIRQAKAASVFKSGHTQTINQVILSTMEMFAHIVHPLDLV